MGTKGRTTRGIPALRVKYVSRLSLEFYAEMDEVESLLQCYDLQKGSRVQRIERVFLIFT